MTGSDAGLGKCLPSGESRPTAQVVPSPVYRIRDAGATFLFVSASVVLLPAGLIAGAIPAVLACLVLAARPSIRFSKRAGPAIWMIVGVTGIYVARIQDVIYAAGAATLAGIFALMVLAKREVGGGEHLVDTRTLALAEMFVYTSVVGIVFGFASTDENRRFLASTIGSTSERFSFLFATSAGQAAMAAGCGLLLAVTSKLVLRKGRRWGLGLASAYLLIGANYRYVQAICGAAIVAGWLLRRNGRTRRAHVAAGAILLLCAPIWWSHVAEVLDGPLAAVASRIPGLGGRAAARPFIDEIRSLNHRADLWSANFALLARSERLEPLTGYGQSGGDEQYRETVAGLLGSTFRNLRVDQLS